MTKFIGTIERTDLEGGAWLLKTDQGVIYQLKGGGDDLRQDGQRAEIEGKIESSTFGIAMVGEVLSVKSYRLIG